MTSLEDIKRLFRETYIKILEKEQDRGYTTNHEKKLLDKLRKQINEGESNGHKKL